MTIRLTSVFAGLLLLAVGHRAPAQTTVATTVGGSPVPLEAVGGGDLFAVPPTPVGGAPGPTSVVTTNVGFSYVRPYWAGSGLSLQAPIGTNPAVAVISPYGNLAYNFGFIPRVDLQYDPASLGFGFATSAQFLSLGGNLGRTVLINGTAADLIASSDLTFIIVNLAEITKTVRATDVFDHPLIARCGLEDDTYGFAVGTRFAAVQQSWHASLRGGSTALAASDATQNFAGLGLTTAFSVDHPIGKRWGLYGDTRWSLLLGPNDRKSAVNGTGADGAFTNSLVENKTTLIPTGELEFGVRYLAPVDSRRTQADGTGPVLSVRAGFIGQFWGNIGFLPANPGVAQFTSRPLFLVGFTLLAGVEF